MQHLIAHTAEQKSLYLSQPARPPDDAVAPLAFGGAQDDRWRRAFNDLVGDSDVFILRLSHCFGYKFVRRRNNPLHQSLKIRLAQISGRRIMSIQHMQQGLAALGQLNCRCQRALTVREAIV